MKLFGLAVHKIGESPVIGLVRCGDAAGEQRFRIKEQPRFCRTLSHRSRTGT
jgi:hypothetical protein